MTISPKPYNLWMWNLYHGRQQRLAFIRACWNTLTSTKDLKLQTCELNMLCGFGTYALVTSCDCISWTVQPMDKELVPLGKANIIVELLWHPINFKTMSPFMWTLFWYLWWIIISLKCAWTIEIYIDMWKLCVTTPLNARVATFWINK